MSQSMTTSIKTEYISTTTVLGPKAIIIPVLAPGSENASGRWKLRQDVT